MDYFSIVMDQYRPQQSVLTRAQAAATGVEPLGEIQVRNAEVYMEVDTPKVKYKQFLAKVITENRKYQEIFHLYMSKCRSETDLKLRIEAKGVVSHKALCPKDKADLSLSVTELDRWVTDLTNWSMSSHFSYKTKPVQLQYFVTIVT